MTRRFVSVLILLVTSTASAAPLSYTLDLAGSSDGSFVVDSSLAAPVGPSGVPLDDFSISLATSVGVLTFGPGGSHRGLHRGALPGRRAGRPPLPLQYDRRGHGPGPLRNRDLLQRARRNGRGDRPELRGRGELHDREPAVGNADRKRVLLVRLRAGSGSRAGLQLPADGGEPRRAGSCASALTRRDAGFCGLVASEPQPRGAKEKPCPRARSTAFSTKPSRAASRRVSSRSPRTRSGVLYQGARGRSAPDAATPVALDSVFRIASMTKAITSAAAMKLVEDGKLGLDQPMVEIAPELGEAVVLLGFDDDGTPRTRKPRRAITLRHLLTHTSGFSYDLFNPDVSPLHGARGAAVDRVVPERVASRAARVRARRALGVRHRHRLGGQDRRGGEWPEARTLPAGRVLRAARHARHELPPARRPEAAAGRRDAAPAGRLDRADRLRVPAGRRLPHGRRRPLLDRPRLPALHAHAARRWRARRCARAVRARRSRRWARTRSARSRSRRSPAPTPRWRSRTSSGRARSKRWGLAYMLNTEDVAGGRAAGSWTWSGVHNTFFWIDPTRRRTAVLMMQLLPANDPQVIATLEKFEQAVYASVTRLTVYTPPKVWKWDAPSGGRFANINRPIAGATSEKELPVGKHALQLYSLATPNGVKVTVMLEELLALGKKEAEYDAWPINIGAGDQFGSGFVAVNPNSKIPALLDRSTSPPTRIFESGAILVYLAEKFGAFLPKDPAAARGVSVVAVLADGQRAVPGRRLRPLLRLRAREVRVPDQPLRDGGEAPARRAGPQSRRAQLPDRRRVHDRRHGGVPVVRRRRARTTSTTPRCSSKRSRIRTSCAGRRRSRSAPRCNGASASTRSGDPKPNASPSATRRAI